MALTKADRELREAGEKAYADGKLTTDSPVKAHTHEGGEWLHGWWKAFYAQRDADLIKIAEWLLDNVSMFYSDSQAKGFSSLIVHSGWYDRTKPITDNRIAGKEFDIPAPSTL